jgi:hypothetical protein
MADDSFNGATLTFATVAVGGLRSISVSDTAPKADCTAAEETTGRHFKTGIPELTITCEVIGGVTVAPGDTGALAIAWLDIGSSTLGTINPAEVVSVSTNGSMDGEITSTVEFCKSAETA